jgi:anti-sigma regulatory factor (Ser/Thr protein kinase)
LPDPTLPENLLKNSGRGLLIIKHLMDEVNIESRKNGTAVIMVKYF